ncbi:GntP family permease [Runella salmonicolor]|uniref:GntP family permease n=1 Tax=Runella salmonicolor TaxID=2950278 RepID=A0ABT1FVG4_9BACT|nr:GntP family permease [Runella salmonicolor]MCP1385769.1 GntP family permease [Runella salmonicolor]
MLSPLYVSLLLIVSILTIILLSSRYKFNTFFVLIFVAMGVGFAAGMDGEALLKAIKVGFGSTLEKIGLLIILGATLGIILDKTNATLSLANFILNKTGERYAPLAITLVGILIGLPIFCDSGFVVLSGLVVSLGHTLPKKRLALVGCLATSLYAVHCLVPPHPGITAAAGVLNVDLGKAMLLGILVALPAAMVGYLYSLSLPASLDAVEQTATEKLPIKKADLPSPALSFLPIIVPIALISLKSVVLLYPDMALPFVLNIIKFVGEPITALIAGLGLTLPLFQKIEKEKLNQLFDEAIEKAGPILIVTAAGGAFGEIIRTLELGKVYGAALAAGGWGLLVPFGLAAIFKTAQGSSTVAVVSTASLVAPLLAALGLAGPDSALLALLAMGAGSMVTSHANDSYFWVISRFGNLNVSVTLRAFTPASALMGGTALLVIYVMKWLMGM